MSVLITLLCVLLCIVAYSRQCAENKGSGKCVWLCGRAASLHLSLSLSLFFFVRFCSPLLVLLSGQGCHTTERRHKEGREKKSLCALSQPEVVIDGRLNKTEEEKHTFCQALENRNHFYGGGEGGSTSLGLLLCMNVILQQQKIVLE